MDAEIRFNRPSVEGEELAYVAEAISQGHTSASGSFSARVSEFLEAELGSAAVLLTTSCTDALEMAALMLDLEPGDRVIVPSFTFVSTALAFARERAQLVFCDIERDTLGLDPAHLAELMDPSVKAVVTVHYAGIGCDLEGIEGVVEAWPDVSVIEDAAHALFSRRHGRTLGTVGRFGALSFHETKNFICGEGGALLVNRPEDVARAHVLRDKGTNRRAFEQGLVDRYTWQDIGSSFGLSDVLAAFLWGQLEQRTSILAKRRHVYERYETLLAGCGDLGLELPTVPDGSEHAFHMYYVLVPNTATRDHVLEHMNERGVHPAFHYVPLHSSPGARAHRAHQTPCPITDDISSRLLRLPFYNSITDTDIDRVVETLVSSLQ